MQWPFILILVILGAAFLVAFLVFLKTAGRNALALEQIQFIKSHWVIIIDSAQSHPAQAILEADKLLDYALKCHGFRGTVAEKLKLAKARFSDVDQLWRAHKLRNRVAHELSGKITYGEAKTALKYFKAGLNDLGACL